MIYVNRLVSIDHQHSKFVEIMSYYAILSSQSPRSLLYLIICNYFFKRGNNIFLPFSKKGIKRRCLLQILYHFSVSTTVHPCGKRLFCLYSPLRKNRFYLPNL